MRKKALIGALLVLAALAGCEQKATPSASVPQAAPLAPVPVAVVRPPPPPVKDHNYELKDGLEYAYSREVSVNERNAGQNVAALVVIRYAGEREGKHQVHMVNGNAVTAMECASPCEIIKVMSFLDTDYMRNSVRVERMKNEPGIVAYDVFEDALAGKLKPYGMERGDKRYQVWVEEKRGFREYALARKSPT